MTTHPLAEAHPHLGLFDAQAWGLVVYDEVHLLPAPVFRATAQIQAVRRLGLTADAGARGRQASRTSSRSSGRSATTRRGGTSRRRAGSAPATCTEIRVALAEDERMNYATAPERQRYRLAATTTAKHARPRRARRPPTATTGCS